MATQRRLLNRNRTRTAILFLGLILIPVWQASFLSDSSRLDRRYQLEASTGLHGQARFFYFYYYLGLYPVATEKSYLTYCKEGAEEIFTHHGDTLLMEWGHTVRYGDLGSIFLYLPGTLLTGSAKRPSVRLCHMLMFTLALTMLFVGFWWIRQPVLGTLVVLLAGANPFQLHEVYAHENIFGWPISTALIVLALHLPFVASRKPARYYFWALPILTGVLLASIRQVRSEPAAIILSAAACYLTMPRTKWRNRLALVLLLGGAFMVTSWRWNTYFDDKYEEARERVAAAGGHPFPGPRRLQHNFWHPIWCGLGDFGGDRGYEWSDIAAASYAWPILRDKYGVQLPRWDRREVVCDEFWDEAQKYYKVPLEVPHYSEVVRDKVLGDIKQDPLWYLGILARRAWRIISQTTPVRVAAGRWRLDLPMHGVLVIPVLALLAWTRNWGLLKLICFSLPLSMLPLLIYSGKGLCYYSCFHVFVAAVLVSWLVEGTLRAWQWAGAGSTQEGTS